MKRLLLGAAVAALLSTPVLAKSTTLLVRGPWEAFYVDRSSTGNEMCGINTNFRNGLRFFVKASSADTGLMLQVMKDTWRFPESGVDVPVSLGVDKNSMFEGNAWGFTSPPHFLQTINMTLNLDQGARFLHEFASANHVWLRFTTGTEPPVVMDATGSREIVNSFARCVNAIRSRSQPYGTPGPQATQPYPQGNVAPQPTGNQPPFRKGSGGI